VTLELLAPDSDLGLSRGDAAVCIPVYGAFDHFAQCLKSVLANTPGDVFVLVADDASPDPAIQRLLEEIDRGAGLAHRVGYLRQAENVGFVRNMNAAFALLAPADVVILNSDCVVPPGWLESLRRAAESDSRVGTVSVLTNNGTIVSVPERNRGTPSLPQDWTLERAAAAVSEISDRIYPELPTGIGHCLYIRRAALDLVGGFDEAFSPGYGEEVDFCQRLLQHGLSHILADDSLVLHHGSASFSNESRGAIEVEHHGIIQSRYRYYDDWVDEVAADDSGPLSRALGPARRLFRGLSVTIDGRCLTQFITGTQVHTLELIAALDALDAVTIRVLVPHDLGEYASSLLERLRRVSTIHIGGVVPGIDKTEIAHRPYQVSSAGDLETLELLGRRTVVTHQDLISYLNPGYFPSYEAWTDYRSLTRAALASAHRVVFFSRHAAREALRADLVDEDRSDVVYLGTDHRLAELEPEPVQPPGAETVGERPFLLCLGTDFLHKNRLFAIRLVEALRASHDWDGALVFAGAHVAHGGSAGEEAAYLAARPELDRAVLDVVAVSEAGKAWLLRHATAMLYPTTFEGFGLVPFEAAAAKLPCLFAPQTSLAELLPASQAVLVPWDVGESAARVARVLDGGPERDSLVATVQAAGARLTWKGTADRLMEVYRQAADAEPRPGASLAKDVLWLHQRVDRDPDGLTEAIPAELRRPLLAIANRRWLRTLIFGGALAVYRAVYFLTHLRRPPAPLGAKLRDRHDD
jgi:GT2 family glycosyltransferase/glycosyltransferase involved in cell wall biosynthesis